MSSGVNINCACGHTDDYDRFVFGQPEKHFQCPKCKKQWRISDEKPTVLPSGFIMPGKRTVVYL